MEPLAGRCPGIGGFLERFRAMDTGCMGRPCTVCSHNSREEIDTSLIGGSPYRDVAGRFGLSKSAIERHASEHLIAAIARVADISPVTAASLIAELRVLRETTLGVLEEARTMRLR